jgi:hypothetical protein
MNCLLLVFIVSLPNELQIAEKSFMFKDESSIGFYLSEFDGYEVEDFFNSTPQRLSSVRYDSLNIRFVGDWPYGPSWDVKIDTARSLAFCGSGEVVFIFDISDSSNPVMLSEEIEVRGLVKDLFYDESNGYIYIAAGHGGLEIWDVSDSLNPQKIGSLEMNGAIGLTVSGDYVYIADVDHGRGLRIIDVSTPSNPVEVGSNNTANNAFAVAVSGSYAYLIDYSSISKSFLRVFDISDPFAPLAVDSIEVPNAQNVDISIDNYLYVSADGLRVFDISTDPSTPSQIAYYEIPGSRIVEVVLSGNYAYLADRYNGLRVIDISVPSNPNEVCNCPTPDWTEDIALFGNYAYVAGRSAGLLVIDISDFSNPTGVFSFDTPAYTMGVEISGDYAYLANYDDGLRIIDISDPENPSEVGCYDTPHEAQDVAVSGNYAYVADYLSGLRVIDISDPENPYEVGSCNTTLAEDVVVSGNYAYVADGLYGLMVIDISDPENPIKLDSCETPDHVGNRIAISGDYAYVTNNASGLCIIDISDLSSPEGLTIVGSFDTPYTAMSVAVSGDYAYLTDVGLGFWVIDISTPSNPTDVAYFDWGAKGLAISGNYLYVGDWWENRLRLIDISNPLDPSEVGYYILPGSAQDIAAFGSYVYVADDQAGLQIYEHVTAGVEEKEKEKKKVLKVTQNIFMGTAEVKVQGITLPAVLNVYDVSGRIKEKTPIYNSSSVKIGTDLSPGIYFVKVAGLEPVKILKLK